MTLQAELAEVGEILARADAEPFCTPDHSERIKAAQSAAFQFMRRNHATLLAAIEQGEADRRDAERLDYLLTERYFSADVYYTLGSEKATPDERRAAIDLALAAREGE